MERNNNNFWSCCQTFASGQRKLLSHAYWILRYLTRVTEVTPLFSAPCTAINAKLLFSLSWSNRFELSRTVTKSVHKTDARFRREGVRQKYKLNWISPGSTVARSWGDFSAISSTKFRNLAKKYAIDFWLKIGFKTFLHIFFKLNHIRCLKYCHWFVFVKNCSTVFTCQIVQYMCKTK